MSKILLMKVSSRERPSILLETVRQYIEKANDTKNIVWLFTFDKDDKSCTSVDFSNKLLELIQVTEQGSKSLVVHGKSESKIHAINRDINNEHFKSDWDILVCASDDQRPIFNGWDNEIRNAMPDSLEASLWFNDGVQSRINTMEILGKNYYNRFGYIYYPEYKSFFSDNESTLVAQKLGKQIKFNKCIIKHEHYAANGAVQFDSLYEKNNKHWKHDEDLYNSRLNINFGL